MSLQAIRTLTRRLSGDFCRYIAGVSRCQYSSSVASRRYMSNTSKSKEAEEEPVLPPRSAVKRKPAPKVKVTEKGDTYKAGDAYYSFGPYTFYDIEDKLIAHRQPQISSGEKMKVFCMDKLNTPDEDDTRRLLPEEYGYLVEWPNMEKPKAKYKPMYSVMEKRYGIKYDPDNGGMCHDRVPL